MRRAIIPVLLTVALAAPAATGARSIPYTGSPVTVGLKVHKPQLKLVVVDPDLPLRCDEGKTKSVQVGEQWNHAPFPKVKSNGKFHVEFSETLTFQILDEGGYVVSHSKGTFDVDVRGRFKNNGKKVSGTLSMSGSEPGPASPPYYEPPEYHNCQSGTLHWTAHKSG
jgi:hypothetical protein